MKISEPLQKGVSEEENRREEGFVLSSFQGISPNLVAEESSVLEI